jgi:hypothetical protein
VRGDVVLFRDPHQPVDATIAVNKQTGIVVSPADIKAKTDKATKPGYRNLKK